MANHPNRNWRSRWKVDLQSKTVHHRDGWVCHLLDSVPGQVDCAIIAKPPTSDVSAQLEERIKKEARTIFLEALNEHKQA